MKSYRFLKWGCYVPVFSYYHNGEEYTSSAQIFMKKIVQVGQKYTILLNPNNPKDILYPSKWEYYTIGMFMGIFTVGISIFGMYMTLSGM